MSRAFIHTIATVLKGCILTACALSFWPYLVAAGIKGQTGDYSHVVAIPLIAAVIYLMSERGLPSPPRPRLAGVLLLVGLVLRAAGESLNAPLVAVASFPLLFLGFVELLFGHAEAVRITFPAMFLLFGFGFVTDILLLLFVKVLMLLSAGAAYDAASTLLPGHGPYIVAGNMIMVPPRVRFDVIEACAGIRGLLVLFVIGSVYGYSKKMNWRQALRFLFLLTVTGLTVNLVRIGATIVFSLLLQDRFSHQAVHDTMNWVVFGPMILLIPTMVRHACGPRIRVGLIGGLAVAMLLVHAGQWHLRAAQGNSRLLIRQVPNAQPELRMEIDQQGVPKALLPYVSPNVEGERHWRWILTSGMVHSNIAHLAVNVGLLLLLGHALRRDLRWPRTVGILLSGQIVGALTGWLTLRPPPGMATTAFMGASCAISGLFGAYLVIHLLARRKWVQAIFFMAIYVIGLWLSSGQLVGAHHLSLISHLASVAAGMVFAAAEPLSVRFRLMIAEKNGR